MGDGAYTPPSILYCTVNPDTAGTVGKVKAVLHVLEGATIVGANGKITTLTVLLLPQAPVPVAPASVLPQVLVRMYLATTE